MNYTIAVLEEVHTGFTMDYGKNGNRYYITIHDKESGIYRSREFVEFDDAIRVLGKLSEAVYGNLYSFDDRVKILMGGDDV